MKRDEASEASPTRASRRARIERRETPFITRASSAGGVVRVTEDEIPNVRGIDVYHYSKCAFAAFARRLTW